MTVHWFDFTSLERKSAGLSCHRMKGRHTYDVVAKVLHDVFCDYRIVDKISKVVTDNGSNFVKDFW